MFTDNFGVQYSDDKKTLINASKNLEGEYVIPDGIVEINPSLFLYCKKLTSIVFPVSVKKFIFDAYYKNSQAIDFTEQGCINLHHIKYGDWSINFADAKFEILSDEDTDETCLVGWFDRELRIYIPHSATRLTEAFQRYIYNNLYVSPGSWADAIYIPNSVRDVQYLTTLNTFRRTDINTEIYIDNYIENVTVENTEKWRNPKIKFRAPMPNSKPVNGKTLELTLAPTTHYRNNGLWSSPITIHSDFVAYITPLSMKCFGEQEHEGCHIVLLHRGEGPTQYDPEAGHPSVDVWESYEFVLNKLHQAGWEV